jgi:hypothetical protein
MFAAIIGPPVSQYCMNVLGDKVHRDVRLEHDLAVAGVCRFCFATFPILLML